MNVESVQHPDFLKNNSVSLFELKKTSVKHQAKRKIKPQTQDCPTLQSGV